MSKKLKEQEEIISKMKEKTKEKEEKMNLKISNYLLEISELKSELELLNGTISNLTEEKEFNNNKI